MGGEIPSLSDRLRHQADNVEADGWLNAARYMREAADILELGSPSEDDGQPDERQEWESYDPDC